MQATSARLVKQFFACKPSLILGLIWVCMVSASSSVQAATPASGILVSEGDSISVSGGGIHSTLFANDNPTLRFYALAVGGSGLNNLIDRQPAILALLRNSQRRPFVVTVLIGANDLRLYRPAVYANRLMAYAERLRNAGAYVAIGTVLPNTTPVHNRVRAGFNEILRKRAARGHFDMLIDYDNAPVIGDDSAAWNPSIYPDGLHPSWEIGQKRMFQVYSRALNRLYQRIDALSPD